MKCLRCGYERKPSDDAPAWQCPSCKVAYVKAAAAAPSTSKPVPNKSASPTTPFQVSAAMSKRESTQPEQDDIDTGVRIWQVARGQKILIYCILLNFAFSAMERARALPELVMMCLYLLTAVWSLLGVVRICSGLDRSQGQKILFMVLSFFPLINLVSLVYLSMKATRMLRDAGWSVGLLGARP